jgi:hypothetical protein
MERSGTMWQRMMLRESDDAELVEQSVAHADPNSTHGAKVDRSQYLLMMLVLIVQMAHHLRLECLQWRYLSCWSLLLEHDSDLVH